jgi:Na+-transporting NADH:ubiquinone oxidoreductase subunit F
VLTIGVGVVVFLAIVLAMIGVLLVARARLVSSGDVQIFINDEPDHTVTARSGDNLLTTLSDNSLFIPSACGGKGSCGVCRVKVAEGGGALLPTEEGHISRGEAREGVRLACQVRVKDDIKIELPEEVFGIKKWT